MHQFKNKVPHCIIFSAITKSQAINTYKYLYRSRGFPIRKWVLYHWISVWLWLVHLEAVRENLVPCLSAFLGMNNSLLESHPLLHLHLCTLLIYISFYDTGPLVIHLYGALWLQCIHLSDPGSSAFLEVCNPVEIMKPLLP